MTFSVVDHIFKKKNALVFPDKVELGRGGVGVRVWVINIVLK